MMTEELKKHEKSIPKKHSIRFTPQHKESFQTDLKQVLFLPIVMEVIQQLGWRLSFTTDSIIEAKYEGHRNRWTEKIGVTYTEGGTIIVKSQTLTDALWDNGNNSKRVRLFIYAFQQIVKKYDQKQLVELEKEVERKKKMEDYEVPTTLPPPFSKAIFNPSLIISMSIVSSLFLGFIMAFISFKVIYIIVIFEVLIAFALGFIIRFVIKLANYTHYNKLEALLAVLVLIVYISNQYFQYYFISEELNHHAINFLAFIQLQLKQGLLFEGINLGWIGLVCSWLFQLLFTFYIARIRLVTNLLVYQVLKVPNEVVEFVRYFFIKEKNVGQIRYELAQMGWHEEADQDDVFASINAGMQLVELQR